MRGKDGRLLYTATCGIRTIWPSERRTPLTCYITNFIFHLQDWLYKMQMIVHKVDPLDTGQKKGYLGHGKHRFKYLGYIEGLVRDGCFGFLVIWKSSWRLLIVFPMLRQKWKIQVMNNLKSSWIFAYRCIRLDHLIFTSTFTLFKPLLYQSMNGVL